MIPELAAKTKEEAILELATLMQKEHFVDDAQKLFEAAMVRESIVSTAVGNGIAFPHVRGIEGGGLSLAFGVSRKGVMFGGVTDEPAHFIFFSTIPTAVSVFYLRLLAGLAESFTKDANRSAALEAPTPRELWKCLVKATRSSVK